MPSPTIEEVTALVVGGRGGTAHTVVGGSRPLETQEGGAGAPGSGQHAGPAWVQALVSATHLRLWGEAGRKRARHVA